MFAWKGDRVRVLGLDPGLAKTGFAVVERRRGAPVAIAHGVVKTPSDLPQAARLALLRAHLMDLISAHRPEVAAVEQLFFNANVRTAMAVGQAAGVALESAAAQGLEVHHYTPLEVKQSVVGVGNASKRQVQLMVTSLLSLETPPPPDAADACALCICHLSRAGLAWALQKAGVTA